MRCSMRLANPAMRPIGGNQVIRVHITGAARGAVLDMCSDASVILGERNQLSAVAHIRTALSGHSPQ